MSGRGIVGEATDAVKTAVVADAQKAENAVVAFVRANALKAIGISTVVGAIVGHLV